MSIKGSQITIKLIYFIQQLVARNTDIQNIMYDVFRVAMTNRWIRSDIQYFGVALIRDTKSCGEESIFWSNPTILFKWTFCVPSLQWRHNGRDGVSNHQPYDCLLKRSFGRRSKKTSKLRVTGLRAVTAEFPALMASNAENVSILWRHHGCDRVSSGPSW